MTSPSRRARSATSRCLGDGFLYGIYALTGALGLQILCAGLGLASIALLHAQTTRIGPLRWPWISLGLFALSDWFLMRPVLFSWAGLLITLTLLEAHRTAPERQRARRLLLALVPLFFVWANVHGFVAIGALLAVL